MRIELYSDWHSGRPHYAGMTGSCPAGKCPRCGSEWRVVLRAPAGACLSIRVALRPVRRERFGTVLRVGPERRVPPIRSPPGTAAQASMAHAQRFMDALEHDHSPREIASIPAETIDGFKLRNGVARMTPPASCPSTSMRSSCAVIRARTPGAAQRHNGGGDNGPTASLADASERGCGASASSGCAAIGRTASTARCVRDRYVSR